MASDDIYILGIKMTKFGKYPDKDTVDLAAEAVIAALADGGVTTRLIPLRGAARDVVPWTAVGDHGGGDRLMLEDIFLPDPAPRAGNERALAVETEAGGDGKIDAHARVNSLGSACPA